MAIFFLLSNIPMNRYIVNFNLLKKNSAFASLYANFAVNTLASMMLMIAIPYQIYHQTKSTLLVGLISLCQLLPLLITALWGGVLADRYDRRMLIICSQTGFCLGSLALLLNVLVFHSAMSIIFIASPFLSMFMGILRPAATGIAQQIVAAEDYSSMSSLLSLVSSISMVLGPALGGFLISHLGLSIVFIMILFAFGFGLWLMFKMPEVPTLQQLKQESLWESLRSGIEYAISRQELLGTYLVDFVAMIFGMPNALFPAIALHYGGAETLGLLYTAPAVGALLVSFLSGYMEHIKRPGKILAIFAGSWGLCIIAFGLSHTLWFSLLCLLLSGAADTLSAILRSTLWNHTIPQKYRGRLSGIEMISFTSGPKLGDTESGLVAAAFGVTFSIVSGGILCVIGVAACCWWLPKFWQFKQNDNGNPVNIK